MAAGLGFKDFVTGEVLTAADVDGYLMQGVWVFASAAARDAAVTSPQEGNFAYLKDTNVTTYYTGSAWANLDTTGMTNPMTTTGDTIYSSSGSTPARLGIGSTGQVLTVAAGVPSWATPAAGGSTFVGCRLYKTANQTMSNSTWTTITYDAESFDTDGFHSTSSNTSRITIPSGKGGYYLINVRVNIDANATGARLARLTVNTNELFAGTEFAGSSAAASKYTFSTIQNLSVGDYVEVLCLQNSGGNLDFVGNGTAPHNEFSVQYLGA